MHAKQCRKVDDTVERPAPPQSPHLQPLQKKAKDDKSQHAQHATSSAKMLAAPVPSSSAPGEVEFSKASKKKMERGGKAKKHQGACPC